jgi:hypothetical protein
LEFLTIREIAKSVKVSATATDRGSTPMRLTFCYSRAIGFALFFINARLESRRQCFKAATVCVNDLEAMSVTDF